MRNLLVAASVRLIKAIGQAQGATRGRLDAVPYYSGNGVTVNKQVETPADNRAPALLLDNVVKSYGSNKAVAGVSLKVHAGEFIALLGPNGAGKSTLFQLLSGLFVPDSGRIEVMGHDMSRNAVPALAGLGIVFQQPTLDLELTVVANLQFHAGLHGMPPALRDPRLSRAGNWLARHLTGTLESLVRVENWLRTPNERELRSQDRATVRPLLERVGDQASMVAELVLGPDLKREKMP